MERERGVHLSDNKVIIIMIYPPKRGLIIILDASLWLGEANDVTKHHWSKKK